MESQTPTTQQRVEPTMRLREEPRLIQFKTGDKLTGILMGFERAKVGTGFGNKYTVQRLGGERVSFWGTAKINSLLRLPDDKGHAVEIYCVGEDTTVKRGENCMKVFEVRVSDEVIDPNVLLITDDDIPF